MRVGIVGAGPAGIFAAIRAASLNRKLEVEILEAAHQPLEKVLISGGGRCNVTHHCFDPAVLVENYPRGCKELRGAFSRFQPHDTIAWFAKQGVKLKVESDGRMFPVTDDSQTIVDCLLQATRRLNVQIQFGAAVREVKHLTEGTQHPQFELGLRGGAKQQYDRILLATGSNKRGYDLAESLGHTIVPPVPSLFTFKISDPRLKGLAGLSFADVELKLTSESGKRFQQRGPLLITHWGLSGPAVLKLSAWGARALHESKYQASLQINLLPESTGDEAFRAFLAFKDNSPRKHVLSAGPFPIPRRYWERLTEINGLGTKTTWADLKKEVMQALIRELTRAEFQIKGKGEFKEEFVTCGGVSLREVDFRTMQSKRCAGLYFAGEILDIDGITGGFNFQSAWTTGWLAGQALAI